MRTIVGHLDCTGILNEKREDEYLLISRFYIYREKENFYCVKALNVIL